MDFVRWRWLLSGAAALWGAMAATPGAAVAADARLPQRKLIVEVRAVAADSRAAAAAQDAGDAGDAEEDAPVRRADFSLGTARAPADQAPPLQQVRVLNGAWAQIRFVRDLPIQWLRAAAMESAPAGPASSAPPGRGAGAIANSLSWLQAGQSLAVQPRWPGGDQPVTLLIRYDTAAVEDTPGAVLPAQRRQQAGTTLALALGRWTTFAAVGAPQSPAARAAHGVTVSTQGAPGRADQTLQVRVRLR